MVDLNPDSPSSSLRPPAIALIGRAVLRLRLYRGWRQIDVERRAGIDQTTLSRLERGRRGGLSIRRLAAVLDALGVGEIEFRPIEPPRSATDIDRILLADRWLRVARYAERRLRR